ncbi:hypothetical protein MLD38_031470 [Melastoma candidum]|uniref:Uncharacterized protein n=1 Tax=Melastoma candidum TaxID=119954 RepID=A0ACB9MP64_9MYRT|nr:hypothetical protein MLD38_031470 [Melastoma candidum]
MISFSKYPFSLIFTYFILCPLISSQLDYRFYDYSCPNLTGLVRSGMLSAIANETRMAASILRLHFHDCLVDGCEASVLLDGTGGEKDAFPNRNSARGFEVIDAIKASVEKACPGIVSCADILALAAREAVYLSGGPCYPLPLGRRDGLSSKESSANEQLPSPFEPLDNITAKFTSKGLKMKDVVVLSGAHTIGFAQCFTFKPRLFDFDGSGKPDPSLDTSFLQKLQGSCPNLANSDSNLAPLDSTFDKFDNTYYKSLVSSSGLLQSDQTLMEDNRTSSIVLYYSKYPYLFAGDFGASMVRMGSVGVLTGQNGQVRKSCRVVN